MHRQASGQVVGSARSLRGRARHRRGGWRRGGLADPLSFAVLTWTARSASDSEARRAIVLSLFIGDSIGFILALISQLAGTYNALSWSTVVLYLLLAAGFGYFEFSRPVE